MIIVTDIGAADHPIRILLPTGAVESDTSEGIDSGDPIGAGRPSVTDLAADINAGPSEDRRRRQIDRRRGTVRDVGREGTDPVRAMAVEMPEGVYGSWAFFLLMRSFAKLLLFGRPID